MKERGHWGICPRAPRESGGAEKVSSVRTKMAFGGDSGEAVLQAPNGAPDIIMENISEKSQFKGDSEVVFNNGPKGAKS